MSDGRASLYLEYYLGRTETPVLDEDGNQVLYAEGAMAGKPKYKIKHSRKKDFFFLIVNLIVRHQESTLHLFGKHLLDSPTYRINHVEMHFRKHVLVSDYI